MSKSTSSDQNDDRTWWLKFLGVLLGLLIVVGLAVALSVTYDFGLQGPADRALAKRVEEVEQAQAKVKAMVLVEVEKAQANVKALIVAEAEKAQAQLKDALAKDLKDAVTKDAKALILAEGEKARADLKALVLAESEKAQANVKAMVLAESEKAQAGLKDAVTKDVKGAVAKDVKLLVLVESEKAQAHVKAMALDAEVEIVAGAEKAQANLKDAVTKDAKALVLAESEKAQAGLKALVLAESEKAQANLKDSVAKDVKVLVAAESEKAQANVKEAVTKDLKDFLAKDVKALVLAESEKAQANVKAMVLAESEKTQAGLKDALAKDAKALVLAESEKAQANVKAMVLAEMEKAQANVKALVAAETEKAQANLKDHVAKELKAMAVAGPPKAASNVAPQEAKFGPLGLVMVRVPKGSFMMGKDGGTPDQGPRHKVNITQDFYLAQTEFTIGANKKLKGEAPAAGDDLPLGNVSWLDAVAICNQLSALEKLGPYYQLDGEAVQVLGGPGYRLPTEAEWERACRAGSEALFAFGDDPAPLDQHGWFDKNSEGKARPVGQKAKNAFGLLDMHGNVFEWCEDWYGPEHYKSLVGNSGAENDPKGPGPGAGRVYRGGSYGGGPTDCECAARNQGNPPVRNVAIGFRPARSLP